MDEVLHANIFFIIASVATVLFCILICLILWQVLKIVKMVRSIVERMETASEIIAKDAAEVHKFMENGGGMFAKLFSLILSLAGDQSRRKRSRD